MESTLSTEVTVAPLQPEDIPAVVELMAAQDARHHALDPRLAPPRSRETLEELVVLETLIDEAARQAGCLPLVACVAERPRGYVQADVWEIADGSSLRSYFMGRNGVAHWLTLPPPDAPDAPAVLAALLDALDHQWGVLDTEADILAWPSRDLWFGPTLETRGFIPDAVFAFRPLGPLSAPAAAPFVTRPATRADEAAVLRLYLEEIDFHVQHAPFPWQPDALEAEFRARLSRIWVEESVEDHAPLVMVVERDGEVVGMTESYVEKTPAGRYGYLNNVAVRADQRGQGVGRALTAATLDALDAHDVQGYSLYYMLANPIASHVWPRLGFEPLTTRYQRRGGGSSQ